MGVYELVRSEAAAGPARDLEAGRCGSPPPAKASPAAPRQRLVLLDVFRGITVLDHKNISKSQSHSTEIPCSLVQEDTQRVFRIPHRAVLDMLQAHLGLSPAQYERVVHEEGTIRVTVLFNTSTLDLGGPISDISVPGAYSTDDETAEDTAAIKAVRYVEDMTNTVVRDINLASSKRHGRRAERLHQELKESRINNMQFARGWLLAVRYMHYFSVHVRNAVAMAYSVGNLPDTMEDISSRLEEHLEERSRY